MLDLVPFEPAHVRQFDNFGGQERLLRAVSDTDLETLARAGPAWTGYHGDRMLGCAGFVRVNRWRAQAWALLQRGEAKDFILIHRAAKDKLEESGFLRVETYVNPLYPAAMRWAKALGFVLRDPYIPYFFPDGSGASYWAWSK